jgi:hypothetical protein
MDRANLTAIAAVNDDIPRRVLFFTLSKISNVEILRYLAVDIAVYKLMQDFLNLSTCKLTIAMANMPLLGTFKPFEEKIIVLSVTKRIA